MYIKYLFLIFCTLMYSKVNSEFCDSDELYTNLFVQVENVKKSLDILKLRMDKTDKNSVYYKKATEMEEAKSNFRKILKPFFDVRTDTLPEQCRTKKLPTNCAEATKCTQRSGYYNINISNYRNHTFIVFCDYNNFEGDWLYILRRVDGSVDFKRPWSDYVNGFGDVDGEHWIGLENLYALTNYNGPQELYVYIENPREFSKSSRYDHFVIGNVTDKYILKSLGRYSGSGGDSFSELIGSQFSTFDSDNNPRTSNIYCDKKYQSGFWFKDCSKANPTGQYYYDERELQEDGVFWLKYDSYAPKTIIFMIRKQRGNLYKIG